MIAATVLTLLIASGANSETVKPDDLVIEAPLCRITTAKRPRLDAENNAKEYGYELLIADFNGDGWCDFALAVNYPYNVHDESYYLREILILGGPTSWRYPAHENWKEDAFVWSLSNETWPTFRVDLTMIAFIYRKSGGAPYVLGLYAGYEGPDDFEIDGLRSTNVYQWDEKVDLFKKVDPVTRDVVLAYYCEHNPGRCKRIGLTK